MPMPLPSHLPYVTLAVALAASPAAAQPPTPDHASGRSLPKSAAPSTPAATRPPKQPARDRKLFDGKSLSGWQTVTSFDFARHGKVRVIDGTIELAAGEPGTAIRWKGTVPRDRYELSLEAMRFSGDDFFCGLTFPVGKEYCSLILGGWGGMVVGLSNIDGQSAVENQTTQAVRFQPKQWYKVRLRVTPKKIEVWLDGESIIDVERNHRRFSIWWEQEPVRPLGIASWRTTGRVRKIRLRNLDK